MEGRSTSVRIDEQTRDRLKRLAEKSGVSITKLITLASAYYVEHVEQTGMINVPLKHPVNIQAGQMAINGNIVNHHSLKVAESRAEYGAGKKREKK